MPRTRTWINDIGYLVKDDKDWWLGKESFTITIKIKNFPERFMGKRVRIRFEEAPETVPKDKTPLISIERENNEKLNAKAKDVMKKLWGDDYANKPIRRPNRRSEADRTISDAQSETLFEFFTDSFNT